MSIRPYGCSWVVSVGTGRPAHGTTVMVPIMGVPKLPVVS